MLKEKKGILNDACFAEYTSSHEGVSKNGETIIFSHFGIFSQDLTNSISDSVEDMMQTFGDKKSLVKRVFSILIEGLQNIRLHSIADDKNLHLSHLVVSKNETEYQIALGNIVSEKAKLKLTKQISNLNTMSETEVKVHYMDVLANGEISEKGGAGLGFITIKMKCNSDLITKFVQIAEDTFYFSVSMKLNR